MASPSYSFSLTNGTTADASQVMQNFNDVLNGVTDGTKDLNIAALTAAGNAAFNGDVAIGNAAADSLSITASLASSIPIKTTNSFDIGAATFGLRALYFGANSQTVKLQGSASMSATWTLTLPVTAGTANFALLTDGAGVTTWTKFFPGATDGAAQTAGKVGEEIVSSISGVVIPNTTAGTGANVALTAGNWAISALLEHNGAITLAGMQIAISTTDASIAGLTHGFNIAYVGGTTAGVCSGSIPGYIARITTAATYYMNCTAAGTATVYGTLRAMRIY